MVTRDEYNNVCAEIGDLCAKHNCSMSFVMALTVLLNRISPVKQEEGDEG